MKYIILFLFLVQISCNLSSDYFMPEPDCVYANEFINLNPLSDKYQEIARSKLTGKSCNEFRYFFKTFIEEGIKTYMLTNFRNDETCFDIKLLVERWDKLGGMRRTNGASYPKELFNLKWEFRNKDEKYEVVYKDMNRIID